MSKLKDKLPQWSQKLEDIHNFLWHEIWVIRFDTLPKRQALLLRALKIIMLLFSNLKQDNCYLRASALTFYSIFAVVPVAALLFAFAKGFGMEEVLYQELLERFAQHRVVVENIYTYAHKTLVEARGGVIAGVGIVLLLFTIIKMISNIENSFNHIWDGLQNRSWLRKFSDYTSLLLICPIFLIISANATVAGTDTVNDLLSRYPWAQSLAMPFIHLSLKLLPFFLSWVIFSFIYKFMPNTRVTLHAALTAGIISGTLYQLWQMLYIFVQIKLSKYNVIYGSLSALPLFLLWMQYSWVIVLFGTELAFVCQNVDDIEFEPGSSRPGRLGNIKLSLFLSLLVVREFCAEKPAPTAADLAKIGHLPIRLTTILLEHLVNAGILLHTEPRALDQNHGYAPALPLEQITVCEIIERTGKISKGLSITPDLPEYQIVSKIVDDFREQNRCSGEDVELRSLLSPSQ